MNVGARGQAEHAERRLQREAPAVDRGGQRQDGRLQLAADGAERSHAALDRLGHRGSVPFARVSRHHPGG